jgi:hypothetical protein
MRIIHMPQHLNFLILLAGIAAATASAAGQSAPAPAALNWNAGDSANVTFLRQHGHARTRQHVVVWAPDDSLDARWLDALSDSLSSAIGRLRSLVGIHDWQRLGQRPVTYYLSPGRFVSHASGSGEVFISLTRIRAGEAPYIHEAAHEVLATRGPISPYEYTDSAAQERAAAVFPLWLSEGLPDVLAQTVATETRFREGDVFAVGGLAKADSVCSARLRANTRREEILEKVGGEGRLMLLFTTARAEVAPVFYTCSQAFTKFLTDRVGVAGMVDLFPHIPNGTWQTALAASAGHPLEELRRLWLEGLPPKR